MKKLIPLAALAAAVVATFLVLDRHDETPAYVPTPAQPPAAYECRIEGQVFREDGAPAEGALVTARLAEPGPVYRVRSLPADAEGGFSVAVAPARGDWVFRVELPDGTGFTPTVRVAAAPGQVRPVTLLPPPEEPEPQEPPNLGGDLVDSDGRALQGMVVQAVSADGEILGSAVTDEQGEFRMRVEAEPRFQLRLAEVPEGAECIPATVVKLDLFDYSLILDVPAPPEAELNLSVRVMEPLPPGAVGWFRLLNSRGEEQRSMHLPIRTEVLRFGDVPFGQYDLVIRAGEFAGTAKGFEFSFDNRVMDVDVVRGGAVRARFDQPARALLYSTSSTFVPLGLGLRQDEALLGGPARGTVAKLEESETSIDFDGLPPGGYRLVVYGPGLETWEEQFEIKTGEVHDFGNLALTPATGEILLAIRDRPNDAGSLEFGYRTKLYNLLGVVHEAVVPAGPNRAVRFSGIGGGTWYLKVGRMTDDERRTTQVGLDRRIRLSAGETKEVRSDQTWRF